MRCQKELRPDTSAQTENEIALPIGIRPDSFYLSRKTHPHTENVLKPTETSESSTPQKISTLNAPAFIQIPNRSKLPQTPGLRPDFLLHD